MSENSRPSLRFVREFTELDEQEAQDRGYLSHVLADFGDGRLFPLCFYDSVRLQQDLKVRCALGKAFVADPGMVVVEEITLQVLKKVINQLCEERFFEHLSPITEEDLASSDPYRWPPLVSRHVY